MPTFTFKAKKLGGEVYSGVKEAADRYELYKLLRDNGDEVVEFKEGKARGGMNMEISFAIFSHIKTI